MPQPHRQCPAGVLHNKPRMPPLGPTKLSTLSSRLLQFGTLRPGTKDTTSSYLRSKQLPLLSGGHNLGMEPVKTIGLFFATALAEVVGCYLPYLWLKQGKTAWLLLPAAASLALFAWLLTLHPTAAGRVYAAYGGVYICVAILWLWGVDKVQPTATDWIGVAVGIAGMSIIMFGQRLGR